MSRELWSKYQDLLWWDEETGFALDVSRMGFGRDALDAMRPRLDRALAAMAELEGGAIANPDEGRMVGHYWLRAPERAPDAEIRGAIEETVRRIRAFAHRVHQGEVRPAHAERFTKLLVVGIGGSALGPQLAADALGRVDDPMDVHFLDNTDPGGIGRVIARLDRDLARTLTVVISKSGGTKETRNGMVEVAEAYRNLAAPFPRHAVAVTGAGSALHRTATEEGWVDVFPMWDWVGGRTSELSAVGLLPAALQGIDIEAMLGGARAMDECSRVADPLRNPAALLAATWHLAGNGRGDRAMVVLPYKDRLLLFSRYLQQLVMESLGKEKDLAGNVVEQGLTVYGNKGSTDQHAFVQQLRDGRDDFFVTFLQVQTDRNGPSPEVEDGATSGDFLLGFLLGTRAALHEKGRPSLTLTLPDVSPASLGALIALYERAVGLYAHLIGVNAYHQPGVEAGKKAAEAVLVLQRRAVAALREAGGEPLTADELAARIGAPDSAETVFHVLEHLAANEDRGIVREPAGKPWEARFRLAE